MNPFAETADGGSGLINALRYGWTASSEGINFRIIGSLIGSAFNWLWLTLSAKFGISLSTIYGALKFITFVLCAASVARFWWVASSQYGRGIRYRDALVMTSLALFGSIQIHALWSNDPVASYPLAGYGGTAVGFAVIAAAVFAAKRSTWRAYLGGTAIALASVLYYEINVGAVIGAGVVLAAGCWLRRRDHRALVRDLGRSALFVGVPAAALLTGRLITGDNTANYGGTVVRLAGWGRSMLLGIGGSLPGSAWRLSNRALGGQLRPPLFALVVATVLLVLVLWWARSARPSLVVGTESGTRTMRMAIVAATLAYGLFAVGIQTVTEKVQNEGQELGHVYTFYAVTSCVVALGLAVATRGLLRPDRKRLRLLAAAAGVAFLVGQSTINWRLSNLMNDLFVPNRQLLDAFDADVSSGSRCQALATWAAGPWPAYYEDGMVNGLQDAYRYYFDEPFCDGFVPPG